MGHVTVIGAANFDVTATLTEPFAAMSANPSRITYGYGGSARNMAHNLVLMKQKVCFSGVFGGDLFGGFLLDNCRQLGMDVHLSERLKDVRTSAFVALNNQRGDRITAAADTEITEAVSPAFIAPKMQEINRSDLVAIDTNLSQEAMAYLFEHCEAPLFVNAVSVLKVQRLLDALQQASHPSVMAVKLYKKDVLAATQLATVEEAAKRFLSLGVEYVYITLGDEGVYCRSAEVEEIVPPMSADVINKRGAGDAFMAGVIVAHLDGIAFPTTAKFGLRVVAATEQIEGMVNPDLLKTLMAMPAQPE